MTLKEAREIIKEIIKEAKREALLVGIDISSSQFKELLEEIKRRILANLDISPEDYFTFEQEFKKKRLALLKGEKGERGERGEKGDIGQAGQLGRTGRTGKVGQRGPRGLRGFMGIMGPKGERGEKGDPGETIIKTDKSAVKEIKNIKKKVNEFIKSIGHNIEILSQAQKSMPDFRKLGMGLQGQIDETNTTIDKFSNAPEDLSSQCDGSTTAFTTNNTINSILVIHYNGGLLTEGVEVSKTADKEITLTFAPASGDDLRIKYV